MTDAPAPAPQAVTQPAVKRRRKNSQERLMFMLIGVFFAGVAVLTFTPETFRGPAIGLYTVIVTFLIFKFGI